MVRTPARCRTGPIVLHRRVVVGREHEADATLLQARGHGLGASWMLAPRASSTSALPVLLETLRLPCFLAIWAPLSAAATNIEQVEMLKLCAPSPPVPTTSTRCGSGVQHDLVDSSRASLLAAAVIRRWFPSLTRRPISRAGRDHGRHLPANAMRRIRVSISSWKIAVLDDARRGFVVGDGYVGLSVPRVLSMA